MINPSHDETPQPAPPENPAGPRRLYLDNAATSFPKPPAVLAAMMDYATNIGASAGRGGYAEAQASAAVLKRCRMRLNELFHGQSPDHFIFTLNCTDALNLAIRGILQGPAGHKRVRAGKIHAITTWMDHNSVLRPYHHLADLAAVEYTHVGVDPVSCIVDPADIEKAIRPDTALIACVHGSNVTGTLQPIREISRIARNHGIPFLVDAAQSAGHVEIDVQADGIDLLAFPGHKGLLGPLGTGALYIRPGLEMEMMPLRFGGTGTISEQDVQPDFMPDRFESGSHNAIGIAGWLAGLEWILHKTVAALRAHDLALCKTFMDAVDGVGGLRYLGPQGIKHRMGVFSVQIKASEPRPSGSDPDAGGFMNPLALADRLEQEYGILTRAGLHCAPLAHTHLGTIKTGGTTRLSFGPFVTLMDVQYAGDALAQIALAREGTLALRH